MITEPIVLHHEDVILSGAGEGTSAAIDGQRESARDENVAGAIHGNTAGIIMALTTYTAAPEVRSGGVKLGDEDIPTSGTYEGVASEIHSVYEVSHHDDIVRAVDGGIRGPLGTVASETLAPGMRRRLRVRVRHEDEDLADEGCDEDPTSGSQGTERLHGAASFVGLQSGEGGWRDRGGGRGGLRRHGVGQGTDRVTQGRVSAEQCDHWGTSGGTPL
jgi:hypothetical protein